MKHTFIVEIDAEDSYKANVVMSERLGYDEDYGFRYQIVSFYGKERVFR